MIKLLRGPIPAPIKYSMSKLIKLAYEIAEKAHRSQLDKAGRPYIEHPKAVAAFVDGEDAKVTALLHDVMEDTSVTADELAAAGIPTHIVEALVLLTHRSCDSYDEYIQRLRSNRLAARVKLADLRHNSDLSRLPVINPKDLARTEKYRRYIEMLSHDIEHCSE